MPTIPHILFRRFSSHPLAEAPGPSGDALLLAALDRQRIGLDILSDDRSGADDSAVADGNRRDQRGVRPDERTGADYCPVLAEPVIVTSDRPRADIRARANLGVADVG